MKIEHCFVEIKINEGNKKLKQYICMYVYVCMNVYDR